MYDVSEIFKVATAPSAVGSVDVAKVSVAALSVAQLVLLASATESDTCGEISVSFSPCKSVPLALGDNDKDV